MAERRNAAPSLMDGLMSDLGGPKTRRFLDQVDAIVPWEKLAKPIRRLPEYTNRGAGRPTWPAVMMLKALMLAKWYALSDEQLEECLQDRLSFRRFVGLSFDDATPDSTTFVRFRKRLREARIHEKVFESVLGDIEQAGLLVREGTLVDATIIDAPKQGRRKDETLSHDPEATYTKRRGEVRFGYKGHIAADRSGIVTGFAFSTARDHDSRYIDDLVADETTAVYADSAYMSKSRDEALHARGVKAFISKRRTSRRAFTEEERRWNARVARIRAFAEHPFAMLKQQLAHRRTRYRGLERNRFDFCMALTACNIKRWLILDGR